jgi:hypothetical protein
MLPTKFRFIWQCSFRGEDFLEINQSETRIACGGHVCYQIGKKLTIFIEDLPYMLSTKFQFIWPSGFRGEDILELNQSETRIACVCHVFFTNRSEISNLYKGPSIDASSKISVHLAQWFQRRRFF